MTSVPTSFNALTDDQLLIEVQRLAACERAATADLLRSLIELDARRLYLREGCSSLFTYCTQVLHLAEGAAYNRIEAARAARRFPAILEAVAGGALTLTSDRALDLLRHTLPTGDVAELVDRALTLLLSDLEGRRCAAAARPRDGRRTASDSRHIPAAVRRAVWQRDEGRCAFVGTRGRCRETGFLEFHHVAPYAAGGAATVENIQRCRAHNLYEAALFFGDGDGVRELSASR
jgi:hypothetical protein